MAGGKETPRQKMIGMMYLVLTALLALQVSSSVLDKFFFLNRSLEEAVERYQEDNAKTLSNIKGQVEEKGNREEDLEVFEKAKTVRERTQELNKYLVDIKEELIIATGDREEATGKPVGLKDEDNVANLMIVKGKGPELQEKINSYVDFLKQETGDESFIKIARDGNEIPEFANDEEQRIKDFTEINFLSTPLAAALASISQYENEIMAYETKALDDLAQKVGAKDLSFDQIEVVALPESRVVAAGANYEAQLFVSASSSAVNPEMFVGDRPIEVENGKGKVTFKVSGGGYDKDGYAKKTYSARVVLNGEPYETDIEYVVTKPVVQVQSQSVQALYLNCGNELQINVPALGSNYDPAFTASGASVIPGAQKGLVTVVPNKAEVVLGVSSGGSKLDDIPFKVRRIPKPEIEIRNGGRPIDEKRGMKAPGPRSLQIKAVPDEGFAQFLPKDARYRVSQWEITLARGSRPVAPPKKVTSEQANLSDFAAKAKAGDRIVIEVKKVQRLNFKGQVEEVNIGSVVKNIALN
ncbi:MAG: gliding motility protein GldM [Bacteroidota bacterium]